MTDLSSLYLSRSLICCSLVLSATQLTLRTGESWYLLLMAAVVPLAPMRGGRA